MKPVKQFLFAARGRSARSSRGVSIACFLLLAGFLPLHLTGQEYEGQTLVEARLISESHTIVPGQPLTVGLHLKMAPGWHTYWKYGGDSGLATTIEWDLPEGIRASEIHWPLPLRVVEPGDMEVYAYKDEVVLLVRFFPSPELVGEDVIIRGRADWLVCEAICIPGNAELTLTLPVRSEKELTAEVQLMERFREELPVRFDDRSGMQARWERQGEEFFLLLKNVADDVQVDFYPLPDDGVVVGHTRRVESWDGAGDFAPDAVLAVPVRYSPHPLSGLDGVLVVHPTDDPEDRKGWMLRSTALIRQVSR